MKKLIFLFSLSVLFITAANAQSTLRIMQSDQGVHKLGLDTVTNAGSISQIAQITGYQDLVTIQSGVTKLTGTAGGSLKLYGSVDGVKYDFATTSTDTLAVGNVAGLQVKTWTIAPSSYQYYKVIYKSLQSTQTSTVTSEALVRKR